MLKLIKFLKRKEMGLISFDWMVLEKEREGKGVSLLPLIE